MNGVIHNCSHGAGTDINTRMGEARRLALRSAPRTPTLMRASRPAQDEMMCRIFTYIDHLVQARSVCCRSRTRVPFAQRHRNKAHALIARIIPLARLCVRR
jgi:hypothetical protein